MTAKVSKKKIKVVAYPLGRIGSSAIMGILTRLGYSTFGQSKLIESAPMNPKGFFELKEHSELLKTIYGSRIYPAINPVPTIEEITNLANEGVHQYACFIEKEFSNKSRIALKSPRGLVLPLVCELEQKYQVKVIQLSRQINQQVDSIYRVWQSEFEKNHYDKAFIRQWLLDWMDLNEKIQHQCSFETLNICFEDLIENRYKSVERIARFLEEPMLERLVIDTWIDKDLVNRKQIDPTTTLKNRALRKLRAIKNRLT